MTQEKKKIGGVTLDYTFYDGQDSYNEGDDEENTVLEALKTGADPLEVIRKDDRWPVLYQLSPERSVIVEPMDLRAEDRVLEIGAGMGALTGALAERTAQVDCVELSERRSLGNAWRNRAHENITIYLVYYEKVQLEKQYDAATLIGVLEYASLYIHAKEEPALAMLRSVAAHLKTGGRLYIAIENRLGMKYFAGCVEDHVGTPYAGLMGYPEGHSARTYTKSELETMLKEAGFGSLYFYYPYPDYKLPTVIYSDDMPWGDALPETQNYDAGRIRNFDERAAQQTLKNTDEFRTFANSFLIEAVKL